MRKAYAVALAVALLGLGLATPSSASTYYEYWGYWHKPPGATAWQYSKVGPSGYYLQQGTQVEGWRFATGTASPSDPKPRPTGVAYDDYCAGHDTDATYRVLLVVDYGTKSGAPAGPVYSCYGFSSQPTGWTVLSKQHQIRDGSDGLICAIDTYPKTGCGEVVSSPAPKPKPTASATHSTSTPKPAVSQRTAPASVLVPATSAAAAAPTATGGGQTTSAPAATSTLAPLDASPAPSESTAVVAKQFVPPHKRGGVPFGFIAACVFVVALVGAVWFQRRGRAG
ncbi:MAG: hypothetical protein QOC82_1320 [Frankiaceae bacterium]|nr:hypothetical protein [Frankiaceae bacterium]